MPSDKPRVTFVADPKLIKRIDRFWHRHDFRSRSKAITWMIEYVLRENPSIPAKDERDLIYYND